MTRWSLLLPLLALAAPAAAGELTTRRVTIELDPAGRLLAAKADLEVRGGEMTVRLGPGFRVRDGSGGAVVDSRGVRVVLPVGPSTIRYERSFDALDAPAHRLAATLDAYVGPEGAFLSGGSGWYPEPTGGSPAPLEVEVRGPFEVVLEATRVAHQEQRQGSVRSVATVWRATPVEPIALVAGPWAVAEQQAGPVAVRAYLYADDLPLAPRYLEATSRFLTDYARRFGPYPRDAFAVVEHFLPTGYGFANFTLLGQRVIKLPFIIDTSLRHEVAHCWWGNGVRVDPRQGNWCEALTTYVADYARAEEESAAAARAYRWDALADYAAYAREGAERSLAQFLARHDGATRAVGYGKGMLVFHAIRRRIGEAAFEAALRELVKARLDRSTSWSDLLAAFSATSGQDLSWVLEQWVRRPGAPTLRLEEATQQEQVLRLRLNVAEGTWRLLVPVAIETADGRSR